jgi:hypothetical protein
MHTLRNHASIHHTALQHPDPTLRKLISRRIEELSDYTDDLAELIHILILEPSDTLTFGDVQLGFSLGDRPIDVIESHPGWYEFTIVLSDDGFGVVLYVPKHPDTDSKLLEICTSHSSSESKESMP